MYTLEAWLKDVLQKKENDEERNLGSSGREKGK